jgi:hypothetical protein
VEGVSVGAGGAIRRLAVTAAGLCLLCAAAMGGEVLTWGGDFRLPIPAQAGSTQGWMPDAVVDIPEHHIIKDLDVRLSIAHSSVYDLQIFLQSPSGAVVYLNGYDIYDGYFRAADYVGTVFDDEAAIPIDDAQAPFAGAFRPKAGALLSVFDDTDSFGTWKLRIYDAYYGDSGTLQTFELMITNPEPATAALFALGTLLFISKKTRSP